MDKIPAEVITLGVNAAVVGVIYYYYRKKEHIVKTLEDTPEINVNKNLKALLEEAEQHNLPSACITGLTSATDEKPLRSRFSDEDVGVVRQVILFQYVTRRIQGFWKDSTRVLRNVMDMVPFALRSATPEDDTIVHVTSPTNAEYLSTVLTSTYDEFMPSSTDWFQRGVDRIAGEVSKGFNESEHMLLLDSKVTVVGEVLLHDNTVYIRPPKNGLSYIIGSYSKDDLLEIYRDDAFAMKIFLGIFTTTAVIITGICAKRLYCSYATWKKQYLAAKELREEVERMKKRREEGQQPVINEADDSQMCLICFDNPREVVFLPCGHICSCCNCALLLPEPKKCPTCRQAIESTHAVYHP